MERGGRTEAHASPRPSDEIALQRGPGVHVVADADPAVAGRTLARPARRRSGRNGGHCRAGTPSTAAQTASLTAAGATEDDSRESVAADAATLAAASSRTLADAHEARLRLLAGAVERAERTCERTKQATTEHLDPALSSGSAIHHDALRHVSAAVVEAQRTASCNTDHQRAV